MRETDLADELFRAPGSAPPTGVRVATARRGGVTVTRVEIAREGLERPRGRYVTLEVPRVSLLDERDEAVIEPAAAELQALLQQYLSFSGGHFDAMSGGKVNSNELISALIDQKSSFAEGIRFAQDMIEGTASVPSSERISSGWGSVSEIQPMALVPFISFRMPSNLVRKGEFSIL